MAVGATVATGVELLVGYQCLSRSPEGVPAGVVTSAAAMTDVEGQENLVATSEPAREKRLPRLVVGFPLRVGWWLI